MHLHSCTAASLNGEGRLRLTWDVVERGRKDSLQWKQSANEKTILCKELLERGDWVWDILHFWVRCLERET